MICEIIFPYIDIVFIMMYKMDNKNMRYRRRGHIEGKASGKRRQPSGKKQKCNRRKDTAGEHLEEEVKEKRYGKRTKQT